MTHTCPQSTTLNHRDASPVTVTFYIKETNALNLKVGGVFLSNLCFPAAAATLPGWLASLNFLSLSISFTPAGPGKRGVTLKNFEESRCVFITAVPITKLLAGGEGG
jgi:hypothetical protein